MGTFRGQHFLCFPRQSLGNFNKFYKGTIFDGGGGGSGSDQLRQKSGLHPLSEKTMLYAHLRVILIFVQSKVNLFELYNDFIF